MPLSKIERDVLELVRDQHAETRMGTPTHIVHAGLNARNGQARGRSTDVLQSMKKRGLLISGPRGWVPSKEGVLALDGDEQKRCVDCGKPLTADEVKYLDNACSACETKAFFETEIPATVEEAALPENHIADVRKMVPTVERIAPGLSAELLDRCAAMHLTLLNQAEQDYADGDVSALSDLQWLRDTGRQLVAAGGEHA